MKKGLIMQGGAMRGVFSCGVMDVLMENDITFDGAIGVSAGAVFGCNYKSKQIGRPFRYISKYVSDYRFGSLKSWLKTGNLFDTDFCYYELPFKLDVFDQKTYEENPMEFYAGTTEVKTGTPVYHKCEYGDQRILDCLRASASLPVFAKKVKIDGKYYLDGGCSDSIPIKFFESQGYDKNIIILTRDKSYIDKKQSQYWPMVLLYGYKFTKTLINHYKEFNKTIEYLNEMESQGKYIIIRPDEPLEISDIEKDTNKIEKAYQLGRAKALELLPKIKEYLKMDL